MGTYIVDVGIVVDADSPSDACKEIIARMDDVARTTEAVLDWWHEGHGECTVVIVEGGGVQKIHTPDKTEVVVIDRDLREDGDVTKYRAPVIRSSEEESDGRKVHPADW